MNAQRYENELRKDADRLHDKAANEGNSLAYKAAAELYEEIGDWRQAEQCREAARRLSEAVKA